MTFYERALGLRQGRRLFDGSAAEMLGAPAPIYLLAKPERVHRCVPRDAG